MIRSLLTLALGAALLTAAPHAAEAATRIKVSADSLRMVNTEHGEAAKAEGNVTIEIPGQVRIHAPWDEVDAGQLAAEPFVPPASAEAGRGHSHAHA